MRLIATSFVTVDGVMEGPGFDEHRDGRNAWALRIQDEDTERYNFQLAMGADALLLGRTTYQIWAAFWPGGHSGIQWMAERNLTAEKVTVTLSAFDHLIGTHFHKVGVGWVGFELPTNDIEGKKGDLVVDVGASSQRQLCFEATTRRAANERGSSKEGR